MSFSVLPPTKTPPSLKNIYKQVASDIPGFAIPNHGSDNSPSFCWSGGLTDPLLSDLTQVAQQGVLWLNTCLTVRAHKAHSHSKKGWETFTTAVLKAVMTRVIETEEGETRKDVVFMAWGNPALKICQSIGVNGVRAHPASIGHRSTNRIFGTVKEPPVKVIFFLTKFWL